MRNIIQVVVVFLILLTCGGMFTIFVLKVREEAARVNCQNHLRQLGIAFGSYHGSYDRFPGAAIPNLDLPPQKRLSWIVALVPFVEANNIYSRMDKEKSWDAEDNRFATEMLLKYLQCPGFIGQLSESHLGPTDYVGVSGIGENSITSPRDAPCAGVFGFDRPVQLKDLKRGASRTILAVETSRVIGAWTAAGEPTTRGVIPNGSPYFGIGGQFGGNHPRGANVVFADGSVCLIEKAIDPTVWEAMATLSGKGNSK